MNNHREHHRAILQQLARQAMLERGLLPDFSSAIADELKQIKPTAGDDNTVRDRRNLLWSSIDNDDSQDLDQLTVAELMSSGKVKILVAISDVDAYVQKGSAIDDHARTNTTSVYTTAQIFPMLPEKISTDLTSLNHKQDRIAIIIEMLINPDGSLESSTIYRSWVRNHAKLAYKSVSDWLENQRGMPEALVAVPGLAENLRLQDRVAQSMKKLRHTLGALSLETIEVKPIFDGDDIRTLETEEKNRAKELIEDFMIAANGVTARYLSSKGLPSLRRVVRAPKQWQRIVEIAQEYAYKLPAGSDPKALEEFLIRQRAAQPLGFPDLSLAIIKLLGSGEYVAELPGENAIGHFGLAVKDYGHSTAPNRRYPDLLTQRLLKAAFKGKPSPYKIEELNELAIHCTQAEDNANKVERQIGKSAAALLLERRIGDPFDAIVTGASEKGTWVRLFSLPVEGKVVQNFTGLNIGERVRVRLISLNIERGFVDFEKIDASGH